jgi:DNA/RNA-binding domain of Phe-tRNA-synthetase-like protein
MKIRISSEVFKEFHPKLRIAFVYVKGIDNKKNLTESEHLLHEIEELTRLEFHPESLKTHNLIAPWVVAQKEFGKEAQHYHTSVEKLIKTVLRNKSVKTKDTLTNILNYLSLKHVVPIGEDDFGKIKGDLEFKVSKGREKLNSLTFLKSGAFYYRDQKSILGTKFDFWKSPRTQLKRETTSTLIHIEVVPPVKKEELDEMLEELKQLVDSFCGGTQKVFILDRNSPSFDFKP